MKVTESMTALQVQWFNDLLQVDGNYGYISNSCAVTRTDLIEAIIEVEEFVQTEMELMGADKSDEAKTMYEGVIKIVGIFILQVIVGTSDIE
jgi:hypothetical protein